MLVNIKYFNFRYALINKSKLLYISKVCQEIHPANIIKDKIYVCDLMKSCFIYIQRFALNEISISDFLDEDWIIYQIEAEY